MFRVIKILNHNSVIATDCDGRKEYILLGKGIGFGKKVDERIETTEDTQVYSIQQETDRGLSKEILSSIDPVFLEITNLIIVESEKQFGRIDKNILCPLADHIAFAIKRIKNNEVISNPLNDEIKALFSEEYKAAYKAKSIIKDMMNLEISDDEIGYIALHLHSALENEKVSQAMQTASLVKE